ncbi:MAG: hypothetical protein WC551_12950 [Patescibacteria group bacterium]
MNAKKMKKQILNLKSSLDYWKGKYREKGAQDGLSIMTRDGRIYTGKGRYGVYRMEKRIVFVAEDVKPDVERKERGDLIILKFDNLKRWKVRSPGEVEEDKNNLILDLAELRSKNAENRIPS